MGFTLHLIPIIKIMTKLTSQMSVKNIFTTKKKLKLGKKSQYLIIV